MPHRVVDPQGSDSVLCSTTQDGGTPLIAAAWWGYNDIVQELLKHGASVNVQDRVIVELYCCALHTDTTVRHDVYCTLWTEVDWAHLHMYTHMYMYMQQTWLHLMRWHSTVHTVLACDDHSLVTLTLSYRMVGLFSTGPAGMAGSVWSRLYWSMEQVWMYRLM